jgi:WD40 repeat protein
MLHGLSLGHLLLVSLLIIIPGELIPIQGKTPEPVSYYKQIRPILQQSCQGCHQPAEPNGGLVVTSYAAFQAGGMGGASFIPGNPEESMIMEYISGEDPLMPQEGDPLTAEEVELFSRWIAESALDDTPLSLDDTISSNQPPVYIAPPVISALAYSPDGKTLAVSGYREILLHKSDGSELIGRLVGEAHRIESIAYTLDGKILGAVGGTPAQFGEVQLWDANTSTLIQSMRPTYDTLYGISFAPNGELLAFGCSDKTVRLLAVADGKEILKFDNHSDWVFGTLFSMDGTHFVSGSRDGALKLVNLNNGAFIDDINASNKGYGGISCISRHPQEDLVLSAGEDRIPRLYRIFRETQRDKGNTDFNLVREFEALSGPVHAVGFNQAGTKIAVGGVSGEVRIYNVEDGEQLVALKGNAAAVFALAFHPNGQQIVTGGFDGTVRIFNTTSGELVKAFVPVPISPKAKEEFELVVTGMTCAACVTKVQSAISHVSGVIDAEVSLEGQNAVVHVEKGKITIADLITAVKKTGFNAAANY